MQTINAIKKLEKAGFIVSTDAGRKSFAEKGSNVISFWNDGGAITCINASHMNDVSR
jgi:hypothetical protein